MVEVDALPKATVQAYERLAQVRALVVSALAGLGQKLRRLDMVSKSTGSGCVKTPLSLNPLSPKGVLALVMHKW
eukprot:COSAG04_NODE_1289_length_7362_cov_3.297122_2_plen_74_part_00